MSIPTERTMNRNVWTKIPMPDSIIAVVQCLSRHNKYGFTYTYNDDVSIPDDVPNDPHDDDEASDDENEYDCVHDDGESSDEKAESDSIETDSMSSIDNVDDPPNTDDALYGEPIAGVEDHKEEPHHEDNTNGHHQGQTPETQKKYPPESQDAPTAEQTMPADTQTTNYQENVQEDEVGDSRESNITHTTEETEVQKETIAPIESTTKKRSQDNIDEESQDEIKNDMNKKYVELSGTYNLRYRKRPRIPREYGELHAMLNVQEQFCQVHHTLLTKYGVNKGIILYKEEGVE